MKSVPGDRISNLLDETFKAFNGAGPDFQSLIDSTTKLSTDTNGVSDQLRSLIDDSGPLLDSQVETGDSIRTWARSLAGITGQLAQNDPQFRSILQQGPGFADEVTGLLDQIKPTLPLLLANLTTIGQVLITYNPSLEQLLVIFPAAMSMQQSFGLGKNNPTGLPLGDFALTVSDPNACTVGFLPQSQWRSPEDTTTIDTPDGLYCKLPQDSPISIRGARNLPCMEHPGKRAPTVELCNDPKGFEPIAMKQHTFGPEPFDPNLIRQGVAPDDRIDYPDRIYAPVEGTPLPPGAVPGGTPPQGQGPPPGPAPIPLVNPGPPPPGQLPQRGPIPVGAPLQRRLPSTEPSPPLRALLPVTPRRAVGGVCGVRPADGRLRGAGRPPAHADEHCLRSGTEVVEGSAPELTLEALRPCPRCSG